jgi:hypothetical protein
MRSLLFICVLLIAFCARSQTYQQRFTNVGRIGLTVSNIGTLGRPGVQNNTSGPPSMEYPINSGIEHLFESGLWIGARMNGQTLVSTAAVDNPTGYATGVSGYEFTAASGITERSKLPSSNVYSANAISHQDFLMNFTDKNVIVPGTSIPIQDHINPLFADVHLETYTWNYNFADYFVICNYTITNNSTNRWDSVWIGNWADLVVRNVNVTTETGTAFYNKGGGGFLDNYSALYAYEVTGDDILFTQSYGAMQYLGINWRNKFFHPSNDSAFSNNGLPHPDVNGNFWDFRSASSQLPYPTDDVSRYYKMANGLDFNNASIQNELKTPTNKTQLISAGPLVSVNPGESITYVIAFVCARQINGPTDNAQSRQELVEHLSWAKRTYLGEDLNENGVLDGGEDLNNNGVLDHYILPEPPASPKMKAIANEGSIDIYWTDEAERSIDPISKQKDFEGYRLYRTNPGDDKKGNLYDNLKLLSQWDSAGNSIGFNNGFSAIRLPAAMKFENDTTSYWYHYKLTDVLNGWQYLLVVTAFDKGDASLNIPSLESSYTENSKQVFPGSAANEFDNKDEKEIGVYPNPYSITAAWDGTTSRTRKLYFYNLPSKAEITIYTSAGDLVTRFVHDAGAGQAGQNIDWYKNFSNDKNAVFAGGEHAWDLLSENKTTITQGLYMFAVKDLDTGEIRRGTFAVVK